jgi:fatty-acid desaturase
MKDKKLIINICAFLVLIGVINMITAVTLSLQRGSSSYHTQNTIAIVITVIINMVAITIQFHRAFVFAGWKLKWFYLSLIVAVRLTDLVFNFFFFSDSLCDFSKHAVCSDAGNRIGAIS